MHPDFWRARWSEGRIGFHEGKPNRHLVEHADHLPLARSRVLVPLCGKAVDLAWLAQQGASVVGVELVSAAAEAFFAEQGLCAERARVGAFERHSTPTLQLYVGDFFDFDADLAGGLFDACWDRAALVALPEAMRTRYVAHLRTLLRPGAVTLLVTFEHDGPTDEPPFSVPDAWVRAVYAEDAVHLRAEHDVTADAVTLTSRGATRVCERVYRIERRS